MLALATGLALAPILASPSAATTACDGLDRPVVFAGLDWDSAAFNNAVAMFMIEHGYGCETDSIPGSTIPLFNGLIRGDVDIYMEAWIPNIKDAWDAATADGTVSSIGVSYPDATQAWFVPRYMVEGDDAPAPDLKSVTDLPKYADLFRDPEEPEKGRFYNCILGWGCEVMNTKKLIAYGLTEEFTNFRPGTGGALAAAIESSILRQRPIFFYYWGPTWVLGKVSDDIVTLEEPPYDETTWQALADTAIDDVKSGTAATAWPTVAVDIASTPEFIEAAPTIVKFFGNFALNADIISKSLAYMQDNSANADEAAVNWLKNNKDVWGGWVDDDVAKRIESALASS
ncbi:MAG: ABC transporter substrate-binding protein [Pseudomonadota bacterium]